MTVRISTAAYYKQNTEQLLNLQSRIGEKQQEISTGVRVESPSDGPLEFASAQRAKNSLVRIEQYQRNMTFATNFLSEMEVAMEGAGETIKSAQEKLTQAKSDFVSMTDRKIIANELRGKLDELLSIANQKDTSGGYLFSGTRNDQPAFANDPVTMDIVYQGTPGPESGISFQVSDGRTMDLSINGEDAFVDTSGGGESLFALIQRAIDVLEDPSIEKPIAQLNPLTDGISRTFDNLQIARGRIGNKISEMDSLRSGFLTISTELERVISQEIDTDLAETISALAQLDIQLQASQRSFGNIGKLSLFDYL